ncbi:MAG: PIG-L family deacetylase, partial [Sedimentisphaerales bacterium]|nr:PIG-L family deacetylase [Sedimentisphaerales bacterium]
ILGEGVTGRDDIRDTEKRSNDLKGLRSKAEEANKILGVKKVFFADFPDNRFDTVDFLDIVKVIEKTKNDIRPEVIFTHYEKDLNIDHQITYKAVITAARPLPEEGSREIYSFEVLSSTEWAFPLSFSPNVFFDITGTINLKEKAMEQYRSELKEFPHPRSIEGITVNAKTWGMKVGLECAEAFQNVRIIR